MTINFNDITDTATPTSGTFNTGGNSNIKGAGQNFLTQSQSFTDWGAGTVTVTASATTAPNSTSTASSILSNSTSTNNFISRTASSTLTNTTYTLSVYAKKLDSNFINLTVYDGTNGSRYWFNISTGVLGSTAVVGSGFTNLSGTITSVGNGWYRCTLTATTLSVTSIQVFLAFTDADASLTQTTGKTNYIWGAQLEFGAVANTYTPTTGTVIYNIPQLTFSGVANIGLQSDGALFVQPAGTGAIQAQATTSTATGGNARGQNATDFQTSRGSASNVASGYAAGILSGLSNANTSFAGSMVGGNSNQLSGAYGFEGAGRYNNVSGGFSGIVSGERNAALGIYNFIGGGVSNSGTANAAVTTQATTTVTSGSTAVTLSGSNANIKVGQLITGSGIQGDPPTFVAAISGTSLTLSQNATVTGTPTLSFFTPLGTVVGGGNNQATGSYSFIGGGGDAGTSSNRNVASGDWSVVAGGRNNTASGNGAFIGGGGVFSGVSFANNATGAASVLVGGIANTSSGQASVVVGGFANNCSNTYSFIGGGAVNVGNSALSAIMGGSYGTTRSIIGNHVFPACDGPIAISSGVSQSALLVLGVETTNATATVLRSNTSAATTTNQVILPNNSAYYFKGSVIANVTGAASGAAWSFEGAIMRGANAASTVLIGTPVLNRVAVSSGASLWSIALTADTTNGGLAVTVTGVASTTIRWVAKLETTEVTY